MQIEKQLHKIGDGAFVERAHQVVKRMQSLLNSGKTPFARVEIEASDDWSVLWRDDGRVDQSDALLWLQELLERL
jgi:hypothetical protein